MEYYFECYGDLGLQRTMVSDHNRTDAFAEAIAEVVKPGDHVLDVGTGTGLLAMLAAKAGAAKATGVDRAAVIGLAKELVAHNGLSDQVEILGIDAAEVELDEKVDVLVSEWLGHFCYVEAMLDDVLAARDRNLKPGGIMLPSSVDLVLAPMSAQNEYRNYGPGFWKEPVHGIDFSLLEEKELQQGLARKGDVPLETLLASGKVMFALDLVSATAEDPWQSGQLSFTVERDEVLTGFLGWFVADLSPSVRLDTGPEHPYTHWEQIQFIFPPREVKKGDVLEVDYALSRHPVDRRSLEVRLELDGTRLEFRVE